MPELQLTPRTLEAIESPEPAPGGATRQVFYRDTTQPGFGVRATSGGALSFVFERRVPGRRSPRRITLGRVEALSLDQARHQARVLLTEVAEGRDPIEARRTRSAEGLTLGDAFEAYLEIRRKLKPGTVASYRKDLRTGCADWFARPLCTINGDAVLQRHQELSARSPARANGTFRVLRAVFNHARKHYRSEDGTPLFPFNPVEMLTDLDAWNDVRPRTRYLKDADLAPWYAATLQLENETARDYLHLVLLTGLRKSEAARIRWAHLDRDAGALTVPGTRNRNAHILPLSTQLHALLLRRFEARTSLYVFPSETELGPIVELRAAVQRVSALSGVEFTLQDLRRTFATTAERLDLSYLAVKQLLNHRTPGMTAHSVRLKPEQLRSAMQRINDRLMERTCSDTANVVAFPSAGGHRSRSA